jgi:multiple sugar transport system permease protein
METVQANTRQRQTMRILGSVLFYLLLLLAFVFFLFPLYWMLVTSLKTRTDALAWPPTYFPFIDFKPTLLNYLAVFTNVGGLQAAFQQEGRELSLSTFPLNLFNSVVIAGSATIFAVGLGTLSAYAFSRFRVRGEGDLLFFILSTRMLPPVVVIIPIFIMYRALNLTDTYLGMILLYTTFNLPFAVWMMKGFFDEIPKDYEEAAMVDGYSRWQSLYKVVLPEAFPAMLATAVFCIITAWNEFVFAVILTRTKVLTVPPFIATITGVGVTEWGRMAASSVIFLIPVVLFTFLARNHLLRGVTFGAVRR